jgi:DNA-binding transcriptional LysR family regulator
MLYIAAMHGVHGIDLNLLVALDALLVERNVTRAAKRVGLTQSAMSHALARLRRLVGDPLLVRGDGGLAPTPRALDLGPAIRRALEDVERALRPSLFDPKQATGKLTIATGDYAEAVLLPGIARRVAEEAPGIDLRVVPLNEVGPPLASGAVDMTMAPLSTFTERGGLRTRRLFDERFVCVVRKEHPLSTRRLTLARFVEARHALIAPRGTTEGSFVDDALKRLGRSRTVTVSISHFLSAPYVIAESDLIITLAERIAERFSAALELVLLAPPAELELVGFTMSLVWHDRSDADPKRQWLRNLIAEVAKKS